MVIMSKYSALLEPVTQALQQVQLDIRKVQVHVQTLIEIVKRHRNDTKYFRTDIYGKVLDLSEKLGIDIVSDHGLMSFQSYRLTSRIGV